MPKGLAQKGAVCVVLAPGFANPRKPCFRHDYKSEKQEADKCPKEHRIRFYVQRLPLQFVETVRLDIHECGGDPSGGFSPENHFADNAPLTVGWFSEVRQGWRRNQHGLLDCAF
jgi:hypothetical protein